MRATAEITRADLKEYTPRGAKNLRKRLRENSKKKGRSDSLNNLNSAIKLLYSIYKTHKNKK
jgi:hypothetical protein